MKRRRRYRWTLLCLGVVFCGTAAVQAAEPPPGPPRRNVVLFVADGLRHGAAEADVMPTFAEVRKGGVDFVNSHALFPTMTTANASAIATGHYLGDTGDFDNSIFLGFPAPASARSAAAVFLENNGLLPDLNEHFSGNYLGEESLISAARRAGLHTAVIGKLGPVLIQDVTRNDGGITADNVGTVIIDDRTGAAESKNGERGAVPLPREVARRIASDPYMKSTYFGGRDVAGDPPTAPRGANGNNGTKVANVAQQKYMMDALTHGVLPAFVDPSGDKQAFVVVYWSRDPDGTQHNEADGPGLVPGINGPTVKLAFENVDNNLKQLLEYLRGTADPALPGKKLIETTDIFITSDHGFSAVSRGAMDMRGTMCETFATRQRYADTAAGLLPPGFVAIDLAHDLGLPMYDADKANAAGAGNGLIQYKALKLEGAGGAGNWAEHPGGSALLGGTGAYDKDGFNASLVVVANGGADLIYVPAQRARNNTRPEPGAALMRKVVASLVTKPYVSGVFVDAERFGAIPGALSLADINLRGAARTPVPAAVVNFRTFAADPANPTMTGIEIADTSERQGQGMHGTFGRQDTYNCMIAWGPDFKAGFTDTDPVSNADIAQTLSRILGLNLAETARGTLRGRVMAEALAGGPAPRGAKVLRKSSEAADNGIVTVLEYQMYVDESGRAFEYFDAAGFPGASVGVPAK